MGGVNEDQLENTGSEVVIGQTGGGGIYDFGTMCPDECDGTILDDE